jgi:hypothetical protein
MRTEAVLAILISHKTYTERKKELQPKTKQHPMQIFNQYTVARVSPYRCPQWMCNSLASQPEICRRTNLRAKYSTMKVKRFICICSRDPTFETH